MLKSKAVCLTMILCAAITVASAQKKPATRPNQESKQNNSVEQNKASARRALEEIYSEGRFGQVNQIYAPNCKVRFGNRSESLSQAVEEAREWKNAAPDMRMTVEGISANGDVVTVNWIARGTHTRPTRGLKPTGKPVNVRGRSEFRFANGKIVEATTTEYREELFRQLGVPKNAATLVITTQDLWASLSRMFPDPLYGSLQLQ